MIKIIRMDDFVEYIEETDDLGSYGYYKSFVIPGLEFFLLDAFNTSNADQWYMGRKNPGRTNMTHEERAEGWLGETDNINVTALGRFQVKQIIKRFDYNPWMFKLEIEKI